MRYNCGDIERILESVAEDSINVDGFLNHIESCKSCRQLIELESDMENQMRILTSKATPDGFTDDVMARIRIAERNLSAGGRIGRFLSYVAAITIFVSLAAISSSWDEIRTVFSSFDIDSVVSPVIGLARQIEIPDFGYSNIVSYITDAPLIILTLIAITTLIWIHSIFELEKALK